MASSIFGSAWLLAIWPDCRNRPSAGDDGTNWPCLLLPCPIRRHDDDRACRVDLGGGRKVPRGLRGGPEGRITSAGRSKDPENGKEGKGWANWVGGGMLRLNLFNPFRKCPDEHLARLGIELDAPTMVLAYIFRNQRDPLATQFLDDGFHIPSSGRVRVILGSEGKDEHLGSPCNLGH